MVCGFWGHKIGMTQIFSNDRVIPVTAVNVGNWIVTRLKTKERDDYDAVQIGCLRDRYRTKPFSSEWLKKVKTYFLYTREVSLVDASTTFKVGDFFSPLDVVTTGDKVDVVGVSKGRGFGGVVKRHGFGGPPGSHGSTMGNRPGTNGSLRRCGKVIKGKKMPGRTGGARCTTKNLSIAKLGLENGSVILIKGAITGKTGSLVFVRKV